MYGLPCTLTLLLRQKHCKHYQNKHLQTPLLPCAVCPTSFFVFAGIWRSQGNTVFPPQCFPPLFRFNNNSNSLWAHTSTQVKKPLNINVCREVNFLDDIINGTIFFILIKLQIFYILLSYSPTSFELPLHQLEVKMKNKIKFLKWIQKVHCIAAKHILQRALKAIWSTGKKKKPPKSWQRNANIHQREIIYMTCQKWAEKLRSEAASQ